MTTGMTGATLADKHATADCDGYTMIHRWQRRLRTGPPTRVMSGSAGYLGVVDSTLTPATCQQGNGGGSPNEDRNPLYKASLVSNTTGVTASNVSAISLEERNHVAYRLWPVPGEQGEGDAVDARHVGLPHNTSGQLDLWLSFFPPRRPSYITEIMKLFTRCDCRSVWFQEKLGPKHPRTHAPRRPPPPLCYSCGPP
jgi:hypothetical protein